ncbi:sn-glycerol-3-phosphate ABC transporter ATP-binding protein UgpC [soil metagenome]
MAKVQFDGIWKRFPDGTEAIKDLNLDIEDGEFMVLVGPSGCGKSTALRMVAGLEQISDGKMVIGDQVVNAMTPKERDIAMVFQTYALYPHMTVADNMGFALKLGKVDKSEIEERVKKAADILGLTEHLDRKPKELSGGQRQRVAMGRAIVREPQAFLMDEPLSNLDAKLRVQMRAEIAQIQERLGVTTIYVTHDQTEAMTMGDRVAVLKRGILQQVAEPQEMYDNPDTLFVAGFIGSPSMNMAEADLKRENGRLMVQAGSIRLPVSDEAQDKYSKLADFEGKKVAVGLRPEHFFRADSSVPDEDKFRAEVTLVEALGAEVIVHFNTDAPPVLTEDTREFVDNEEAMEALEREAEQGRHTFVARLDPAQQPRHGEEIDVAFRSEFMHFFNLENGKSLR